MMIRNFIFFALLVTFNLNQAQTETLEQFPLGQDFYARGRLGVLQDMTKIAKDLNLEVCENTDANIQIDILVYPDATVKYVKMPDEDYIEKNKCAYDFGKKIIPHLTRWMPARMNGESVLAMTKVIIDPFVIVHSKENVHENIIMKPSVVGGYYRLDRFREQIYRIFSKVDFPEKIMVSNIYFTVDKHGEMVNFEIEGHFDKKEKELLLEKIQKIKFKWQPGSFNNIPKSFRMQQKVIFDENNVIGPWSNPDFSSVTKSW